MSDEYVPIQVRGIVSAVEEETTGADMEKINKNALESLSPSEVFIFEAYPSNKAVDSYYTQMAESSLKNFDDDLVEGRALMNSHRRHDTLPLGYSFDATLDERTWMLLGKYFLQRGLNLGEVDTDQVIRGIQGGTLRDVSIGFKPGWYRCSICGKDLMSYEGENRCDHIPGVEYEKRLCTAWVEDGYLAETSLVFDGATPGAIIKKAMAAYEKREITPMDVRRLEGVYHVRFPTPAGLGVGVDLKEYGERPGWDETDDSYRYRVKNPDLFHGDTFRTVKITTGVSAVMGKLKADKGKIADKKMKVQSLIFSKDSFKTLSAAKAWLKENKEITRGGDKMAEELDIIDDLEEELEEEETEGEEEGSKGDNTPDEGDGDTPNETPDATSLSDVDALVAKYEEAGESYHAPGDRDVAKKLEGVDLDETLKDAEAGRDFTGQLIELTIKARVCAQGDGFDADKYREHLRKSSDLDYIRGELRSYKKEAGDKFYEGRRTDTTLPGEGTPENKTIAEREADLEEKAEKEIELLK